jgi:hypothetical protein
VAGFHARRVTVRSDHSTLRVTIRDASVSLARVLAIAGTFESVRYCQSTGESLCGGNTYVNVEYADALVDPIKATIVAVLDSAPDGEYVSLPGGFRAMKMSRQHGCARYLDHVHLEGPGFNFRNDRASGVSWAAERVAVAHLDASASAEASTV